ncbi:MAG: CDP-glycerol glycerophosphotransferase family protein [Coriobacteriia bacterium]|nr:CDP-glycerol glycerophosphotransferase family protein [Coriobacteriia bacterium]
MQDRIVLFESRHASRMGGSPFAVFRTMLDDPFYRDFTFVWALDDTRNPLRRRYARRGNVRFCRTHSRAYARTLCTAGYLVNDTAWPFYFSKRQGQVYVATGHGTPVRKFGTDLGGSTGQAMSLTRDLLHTDYLVMPNRFASETILRAADVGGIFSGRVIEEGHPRSDLTLAHTRDEAASRLADVCGVDPATRIVLYAPEWRREAGVQREIPEVTLANLAGLRAHLPEDHELLFAAHDPFALAARPDLAGVRFVPDWMDMNEVLAAADVLVTDYSPYLFDYLVLGRPIVLLVPDLGRHVAEGTLYFDMHRMPGPLCATAEDAAAAAVKAEADRDAHERMASAMREEYCAADDGRASARVCDIVFRGADSGSSYRPEETGRKRLLIAGCDFESNGRSFEVVDFSRELDHSRFDLTVLFTGRVTLGRARLLRMLHPRTRIVYAPGRWTLSPRDYLRLAAHRAKTPEERCAPEEIERVRGYFEDERRRLLGEVTFDVAVCFTDRLSSMTYLLSVCEFPRRIMWLAEPSGAAKLLPVDFVMERFDRILCAPGTYVSPLLSRIARAERVSGTPDGESIVQTIDRFSGFENSIDMMHAEEMKQIERRIPLALAGAGLDSHSAAYAAEYERLRAAAESDMSELTDAVRAHVSVHERSHGLDHAARDRRIIETFYRVAGH